MATFTKFNAFVADAMNGVHNLGSHTLKILLTNTAPTSSNSTKSNLTEISSGNGYTSGGETVANVTSTQTSGTYKLVGDDVSWTASGGSIGPWRYAVLYNDTPTSPADPLIGFWDKGESVTTADGDTITVDLSQANGIFQLS